MAPLSDLQIKINTLISRKERYYRRIQQCYEVAKAVENNQAEITKLSVRVNDLESIRESFEKIVDEISALELKNDPNYKIVNQEVHACDDIYFEILRIFQKYEPSLKSSNHGNKNASERGAQPRLPKIELVHFDGNLENWITFRDTFSSLIHSNTTIGDIEKFYYLLSVVTGPALQIVKSLPVSSDNYNIVWTTLCDRYENKRAIATRYMDKLFAFKPLPNESLNGLNSFLETFQECVQALELLGIDNLAGFILCYIGLRNLDQVSRREFEQKIGPNKIPVIKTLIDFVTNQTRMLEMSTSASTFSKHGFGKTFTSSNQSKTYSKPITKNTKTCLASSTSTDKIDHSKKGCLYCNKPFHSIYKCFEYIALTPAQRVNKIKEMHLCENCLRQGHASNECPSKITCTVCKNKHHHTLHVDPKINLMTSDYNNSCHDGNQVSLTCSTGSTVLLGTAIIHVLDVSGKYQPVRVVIDSGSQSGFMTNDCAQRLGLPRQRCNTQLTGLGGTVVRDHGMVLCKIKPTTSDNLSFNLRINVVSKISGDMPSVTLSEELKLEYKHLLLADPTFYSSGRIDMLLGSDVFPFVYDGGRYYPSRQGLPVALSSVFGYVITGQLTCDNTNSARDVSICMLTSEIKVDDLIKSFWETESLMSDLPKNPDDVIAEHMFANDHKRDSTGRYIVKYPFKPDAKLGDSKQIVIKRYQNLERKLSRLPDLKKEYKKFMDEYSALGHMRCVGEVSEVESGYVIPHHCVHKPDSSSTRLRVVFDASCQTSNNESLNSILYTGPKLQADLVELLIRFRLRKISLCGDISKMYRCILIDESQRKYQHVLWRDSPCEPIKVYELCTVTYGVASSPFLAIRTLQQLATDEGARFPDAARALREGFYVDDLIWSVDSVEEALSIQQELVELLKLGGFDLRKWSSNSDKVLEVLPSDQLEPPVQFDDGKTMSIKILGLHWLPKEDAFSFRTTQMENNTTKRSVLSQIAKLYDPLGYVNPCIFLAKNFMQKLWCAQLGWDDSLPTSLLDEWSRFSSQIPLLSRLKHDRHVFVKNHTVCQVVGFCDASTAGFAAVVYIRSQDVQGNVNVSLLLSKSKVAPLKTVSIPRLELMAAHLLSKTLRYVIAILSKEILIGEVLAFTDSSVALTWINTPAFKLKTFVANRVTKINESSSEVRWFHVNGIDNPADVCSRGSMPADLLLIADQWFRGPQWLYGPQNTWPVRTVEEFKGEPLELKSVKENTLLSENITVNNDLYSIIQKFSNFNKLLRVFAWCYRFINNCKALATERVKGALLTVEINKSHDKVIQIVQYKYFEDDIRSLTKANRCSQSLRKLDPFIDSRGLLMVGGRLSQADLPFNQRHPLILPKKSHVTNILIDYYHKVYLHTGPRSLQNILTQRYWIIAARCVIRSRLSKCVTCFKNRPTINQPKMDSLPKCRLQSDVYPFNTVGTDIGGPFYTKESNRRNAKILKAYLCLFVCYSTRAVHLEVVSALTTECFLAAFDRFVARRGLPHTVYSDNGKNYVSAGRHLNEIYQFYTSNQNQLTDKFTTRKVTWKHNPPTGSHFGGIFEAGIKSAKYHLKRVVGTRALTFEELCTLFSNIEAILNSRPLCSLSNDPNEFDVLTPGHFLVGRQLVSVPSHDISDVSINRLTRWQCIQQATLHFWRRWKLEYLHTLQQRQKWYVDTLNLSIDDLVLIHNDNLPCQQWSLGRVEKIHPGPDGRVRIVTVRTQNAQLQRPVTKLSPLPKEQE